MLAAIESLLSAVHRRRHDDTSTIPTPSWSRWASATSCAVLRRHRGDGARGRERRRTSDRARAPPFAGGAHAVVVLVAMLALAPLIAYVPMASLAALMVYVAWNMPSWHNFVGIVRVAPKSDVPSAADLLPADRADRHVVSVSSDSCWPRCVHAPHVRADGVASPLDASQEGGIDQRPEGGAALRDQRPVFSARAEALRALSIRSKDESRCGHPPWPCARHRRHRLVALENTISGALKARRDVILAGPLPKPRRSSTRQAREEVCRAAHRADIDAAVALAGGCWPIARRRGVTVAP